ncbi:MAG: hypothetical protein J0L89_13125, partial [Xanthomonadales bacterium]|nr:hypothetical protein [Xanthomonadales bacterium]
MPPAYIHFLLIPHPSENQILMLSDETGQRLPHFETAEPHYWQTVAPVTQKVSEHLGIRLATLRCMKTEFANDNITLFYAIDGSLIPA